MSIRGTALFACITGVLSLLWPVWNLAQRWPTLTTQSAAITLALTLCFSIAPIFYFALWQNKAPLTLDKGLRNVSLFAAIVFGVLIVTDLQGFLQVLNLYATRVKAFGLSTDPESIGFAIRIAGEASNVGFLLLLIALARAPERDMSEPQSGFLDVVSRIDVVITGLWLVFMLVQTASTPYTFWQHREQIIRAHQESQLLRVTLTGPIRNAVTAACIFVAPYVVCIGRRIAAAQAIVEPVVEDSDPGLEAIDQPS